MMATAEWIEHVGRRLAAAIARETPEGLGRWEPAWDRVEAPSRAFLEATAALEQGESDRPAVVRAAEEVLAAWRRAGMEWRAEVDR